MARGKRPRRILPPDDPGTPKQLRGWPMLSAFKSTSVRFDLLHNFFLWSLIAVGPAPGEEAPRGAWIMPLSPGWGFAQWTAQFTATATFPALPDWPRSSVDGQRVCPKRKGNHPLRFTPNLSKFTISRTDFTQSNQWQFPCVGFAFYKGLF